MQVVTDSMHEIAKKTKQETVSMKIITLVTLFFLPGTFISVSHFQRPCNIYNIVLIDRWRWSTNASRLSWAPISSNSRTIRRTFRPEHCKSILRSRSHSWFWLSPLGVLCMCTPRKGNKQRKMRKWLARLAVIPWYKNLKDFYGGLFCSPFLLAW